MDEKRMTQEQKLEIVRQYYQGKSVKQLAKESGRTASTIYRWLKEIREIPPERGEEVEDIYVESSGCFTIDNMSGFYETYYLLREETRLVRGNNNRRPLCYN
jgi:transposase-like protein